MKMLTLKQKINRLKKRINNRKSKNHPKPDPTPYNQDNPRPQPVTSTSRDESAEKLRKELESNLTQDLKMFATKLIEKKKTTRID